MIDSALPTTQATKNLSLVYIPLQRQRRAKKTDQWCIINRRPAAFERGFDNGHGMELGGERHKRWMAGSCRCARASPAYKFKTDTNEGQ
jgi:hypothetical protein